MLEVIEFTELPFYRRRYGLRNTWTGIVLRKSYWTIKSASKGANKTSRNLSRTIHKLAKKY